MATKAHLGVRLSRPGVTSARQIRLARTPNQTKNAATTTAPETPGFEQDLCVVVMRLVDVGVGDQFVRPLIHLVDGSERPDSRPEGEEVGDRLQGMAGDDDARVRERVDVQPLREAGRADLEGEDDEEHAQRSDDPQAEPTRHVALVRQEDEGEHHHPRSGSGRPPPGIGRRSGRGPTG